MPVTKTLQPRDSALLRTRIYSTKPGEEYVIIDAVREHIDEWGYEATFEQNEKGGKDIRISPKCIVFLIQGKFKVGGEVVKDEGVAHMIEREEVIRLQSHTGVVILKIMLEDRFSYD